MTITINVPSLQGTLTLFDPKGTVVHAIGELGRALGKREDDDGIKFIHEKFDEFEKYITDHATSDPVLAEEMPAIIKAWVAEQDALIAIELAKTKRGKNMNKPIISETKKELSEIKI
jgi:hypothetical protein